MINSTDETYRCATTRYFWLKLNCFQDYHTCRTILVHNNFYKQIHTDRVQLDATNTYERQFNARIHSKHTHTHTRTYCHIGSIVNTKQPVVLLFNCTHTNSFTEHDKLYRYVWQTHAHTHTHHCKLTNPEIWRRRKMQNGWKLVVDKSE